MANRHRGEVALVCADRRLTLCLTLGALAELEDAFGADDLGALGRRFASGALSSRDLTTILAVAIRGGGQRMSDAEVASLVVPGGLPAIAAALEALFFATFGGEAAPPDP